MWRRKLLIAIGLTALVLLGYAVYLLFAPDEVSSPPSVQQTVQPQPNNSPKTEPEKPTLVDVQPVIDAWAKNQNGSYSVVVYDLDNEQIVAKVNKDKVYFAASIYKLYVAYEGYLAAQHGEYALDELYLNGQTRGECLDKMIRESDSPCAEKLWNELGKEATTQKLKTYGITETSMTGITTTAQDTATLLARIWNGEKLSEENKQKFLDSMKTQPDRYRRGLPSGFPANTTVYNKVGWNLDQEWHDTAIISLPNNRNYVVTVFTENVGLSNVRELGADLFAALN